MIVCPNCRTSNEEHARFCQTCGRSLQPGPSPRVRPEGGTSGLAPGLISQQVFDAYLDWYGASNFTIPAMEPAGVDTGAPGRGNCAVAVIDPGAFDQWFSNPLVPAAAVNLCLAGDLRTDRA